MTLPTGTAWPVSVDGVLVLRRNDLQPRPRDARGGVRAMKRGNPAGSESTGGGSMTSKVEKSIEVEAPLKRVYNQAHPRA